MASEEQPPPYYFSFANLSCGFLDGLCQTEEDEEYIVGEPKMDALPSPTEAPGPREPAAEPAAERPPMARQSSRRVSIKKEAVDTFKSHLKKGLMVTKHCRDGKSRPRLLFCDDACANIGWKQPNGNSAKTTDMMPLADVEEVRSAVEIDKVGSQEDKKGRTLAGTATLRKCIEGTSARRAFSLIFKDRTVDIEVATEDDARNTIRYFKVLVAEAKA